MSNIDFNKKYTIHLTSEETSLIYQFLTVSSYDRLYTEYVEFKNDTKDDAIARNGSGEKLHFIDKMKIMSKEDEITDSIVKNQLALGLLLEHYAKSIPNQKDKDIKKFTLNTILMYELYISVSERIIECDKVLNKINGELGLDNEKNITLNNKRILTSISDKIYNSIGINDFLIIKIDYKDQSIQKHLDKCLM